MWSKCEFFFCPLSGLAKALQVLYTLIVTKKRSEVFDPASGTVSWSHKKQPLAGSLIKGDEMNTLQVEIEARKAMGCELLTVPQFVARFAALGYRVDRSMDARSTARYLETGRTYPACSTGMAESDTGRSAFHYEARRDSRFEAMQALRQQVFAVSRGAILEA